MLKKAYKKIVRALKDFARFCANDRRYVGGIRKTYNKPATASGDSILELEYDLLSKRDAYIEAYYLMRYSKLFNDRNKWTYFISMKTVIAVKEGRHFGILNGRKYSKKTGEFKKLNTIPDVVVFLPCVDTRTVRNVNYMHGKTNPFKGECGFSFSCESKDHLTTAFRVLSSVLNYNRTEYYLTKEEDLPVRRSVTKVKSDYSKLY